MGLYLVTGGCGFIGSHVADRLVAQGHRVRIVDDLSTGSLDNAPAEAEVLLGDITDPRTLQSAFAGIDGCFHLAAVASVQKSVEEWYATHRINATGTVQVFDTARERRVPVVYTSSAAVYGDCRTVPISETTPPAPLTAYGSDKLSCDINGDIAWRVHRVPNIGLRPFNVYGPRQDPGSPYSGVISIFVNRIRAGKPITIYGDGEQVRDFIYVRDVAMSYTAAMERLQALGADDAGHDVVNLCTGRGTTINALAAAVEDVCGTQVAKTYAPARAGDIRTSVGDPHKLEAVLGIRAATTLHEGLARMGASADSHTPTTATVPEDDHAYAVFARRPVAAAFFVPTGI